LYVQGAVTSAESPRAVVILGVDPGSRNTGWGVVQSSGHHLCALASGVIAAAEELPLAERLRTIHAGIDRVIAEHRPVEAAVEAVFFARSARSALVLGQARGVALLACAQAGLAVAEYPPARVKAHVSGYGQAEKAQVALSVRMLLGMTVTPKADAADALAIALTHARLRALLARQLARVSETVVSLGRRPRRAGSGVPR
jgi:crossover junction endodeoxyribonuclease RuvC